MPHTAPAASPATEQHGGTAPGPGTHTGLAPPAGGKSCIMHRVNPFCLDSHDSPYSRRVASRDSQHKPAMLTAACPWQADKGHVQLRCTENCPHPLLQRQDEPSMHVSALCCPRTMSSAQAVFHEPVPTCLSHTCLSHTCCLHRELANCTAKGPLRCVSPCVFDVLPSHL
eukprot:1158969-Pelagomonas_calceolata.AAC.9